MPDTVRLSDILEKAQQRAPGADFDMIRRAYIYSAKMHDGQKRASGEPYLIHPLTVAYIVSDMSLDTASICAALLHDCIEDTLATPEEMTSLFGEKVTFLVDGVTKLSKMQYSDKRERQAETFRKMLIAMASDLRVLLIKLADRLHNMRTLEHMPEHKRREKAKETMDIYAPLAGRMGIYWMKEELEDLSFKYLEPEAYQELAQTVAKTRAERERYIAEVVKEIEDLLKEKNINATVKGRPKHLYSIHRKMLRQGIPYEKVYDAIAFRVFCDDMQNCYATLGEVHGKWTHMQGRFKDYISRPKLNGYQSLHTTVIGPAKEPIEVQIRTWEMHEIAEHGIAAHWRYKEGLDGKNGHDLERFEWLRKLMETNAEVKDPEQFYEAIRSELFQDDIYVFTPAGDVIELPQGATPIDFAYEIHTEVGKHCAGARVNGAIVPLRHELKTGDRVEIITNKSQEPRKAWLEFAVSDKARRKIRSFLQAADRERARSLGAELLEQEIRRRGMSYRKLEKSGELDRMVKANRFGNLTEMFVKIGFGKVEPRKVVAKIFPEDAQEQPAAKNLKESQLEKIARKLRRGASSDGVRVDGIDGLLVSFGKCCHPVWGDEIVGFVTRGRGLTVHRAQCPRVHELDPERRIAVTWDDHATARLRPVTLRIVTENKPGMLAALSKKLEDAGVNISRANALGGGDGRAVCTFTFSVKDKDELDKIIKSLKKVRGVFSIKRL